MERKFYGINGPLDEYPDEIWRIEFFGAKYQLPSSLVVNEAGSDKPNKA